MLKILRYVDLNERIGYIYLDLVIKCIDMRKLSDICTVCMDIRNVCTILTHY